MYEFLLEDFDFPLVLGTELLELLLPLVLGNLAGLRLQGEHWLFIGILSCLAPTLHLLREEAPLTAVGTELGGIQVPSLMPAPPLRATATPSSSSRSAAGVRSSAFSPQPTASQKPSARQPRCIDALVMCSSPRTYE